jgi:hypothetical protein
VPPAGRSPRLPRGTATTPGARTPRARRRRCRRRAAAAAATAAFRAAPPGRERSSALLHRSAHYLHARALADELESQSATWQLVLHLYAMGEQPAGLGGPQLPGAGGRQTHRQALRGAVNGDAALERCAHVISWLESLAAQRLAAAPPVGFSAADGVWRETLLLARAPGGGGGGAELDPDAPTRGAAALKGEDQRGEERLAAQLWQLLRAGGCGGRAARRGAGCWSAQRRRAQRPPSSYRDSIWGLASGASEGAGSHGERAWRLNTRPCVLRTALRPPPPPPPPPPLPPLPPPGKLQQALELCRKCGQHWRAAALAGGGAWGPLPVGAAAADMDDVMEEETQAEDLAWEVGGRAHGGGAGEGGWGGAGA